MATFAGFLTIALLILPIWYFLLAAAYWKMFKKMDEPGWKGIIPFLNTYTMFKYCWRTSYFWLALVGTIGACVFNYTGFALGGDICTVIAGVTYMVVDYYLARSFGKGLAFTAGLIFLNPIFMLILGLGSSEYEGNLSR